MNLLNIQKFDKKKYNFQKIFFSKFNTKKKLQEFLKKNNSSFLLEYFYSKMRTKEFQTIYKKFLIHLKKKIKYDFYYQYQPSIRIQKPKDKDQPFHVDSWVGHGKSVNNIWLPLVDTNTSNTLQIVSESDSSKIKKKFIKEKLNLDNLFQLCKNKSKPFPLNYGEYIMFNEKHLHGQTYNDSDDTRISFDFRILKKGNNPGLKDIGSFYLSLNDIGLIKKPLKINAVSLIYSVNQVKHVSHKLQRLVIEEYAKKNNLIVVRENSEWHYVNHYPQLQEHLKDNKNTIIIFSDKCLPINIKERKNLLKKLKKYKKGVHFALENYKL